MSKNTLDMTDNSSVYKKIHKEVVAQETGKCDRCPWHDRENRTRAKRTSKPKKNNHR